MQYSIGKASRFQPDKQKYLCNKSAKPRTSFMISPIPNPRGRLLLAMETRWNWARLTSKCHLQAPTRSGAISMRRGASLFPQAGMSSRPTMCSQVSRKCLGPGSTTPRMWYLGKSTKAKVLSFEVDWKTTHRSGWGVCPALETMRHWSCWIRTWSRATRESPTSDPRSSQRAPVSRISMLRCGKTCLALVNVPDY